MYIFELDSSAINSGLWSLIGYTAAVGPKALCCCSANTTARQTMHSEHATVWHSYSRWLQISNNPSPQETGKYETIALVHAWITLGSLLFTGQGAAFLRLAGSYCNGVAHISLVMAIDCSPGGCLLPHSCILPPLLGSSCQISRPKTRRNHSLLRGVLRRGQKGTVYLSHRRDAQTIW